jgi:kynurenine 3-monooxygenase
MDLWQTVKQRGFSSERFILHIGPLSIRLRDEGDSKDNTEPSLLLYQSDLCGALADELELRWMGSGRLRLNFNCGVSELNLQQQSLVHSDSKKLVERFDLVIGCDGVNSIVRKQIATAWSDFQSTQELLPGVFKVIQCASMPPLLDPTAVQLVFPKSGSVTAFVEPISDGRCCILFAGNNATDILLSGDNKNQTMLEEELTSRYPKLIGIDSSSAAKQLMEQGSPAQAPVVTCNTYHYGSMAVLTGDAAHATGGVSGQGVNSALQDATVLVNSLLNCYDRNNKVESISSALLQYSQAAVPEGKALYDLSFGPKPKSLIGKMRYGLKSARDVLFKGRFGIGELPLQTMLTLSLKSFADIRRDRDPYYDTPFPDQSYWNASLAELDAKVKTLVG